MESLNDPESVVKMLVFTIFALIFVPESDSGNDQPNSMFSIELLKTLKCTLYSKDIRMQEIKKSGLNI